MLLSISASKSKPEIDLYVEGVGRRRGHAEGNSAASAMQTHCEPSVQ